MPPYGEGQGDDVAGHVGDEHPPELEEAEGVDEAGDYRQEHQQPGEWTVRVVARRCHGVPGIFQVSMHGVRQQEYVAER